MYKFDIAVEEKGSMVIVTTSTNEYVRSSVFETLKEAVEEAYKILAREKIKWK